METKNQTSKNQTLTISEIIDINRNLSSLLAKQEIQIKDMWNEILYWRNSPIDEENKKLEAENNVLRQRISSMLDEEINSLRAERGLGPMEGPNPSKIYLSVSTSKE